MSGNELVDLSPGTLRQRRNLIGVSLILIVGQLAQVEFGEEIRLAGISATIGNPKIIPNLLVIAEVYFMWRFYKYFHEEKAYRSVKSQLRDLTNNALDQEVHKQVFAKRDDGAGLKGGIGYRDLMRISKNEYVVTVFWNSRDGHGESIEETIKISARDVERKRIGAAARFVARGRVLSDYYVPFMLAVTALGLQLYASVK